MIRNSFLSKQSALFAVTVLPGDRATYVAVDHLVTLVATVRNAFLMKLLS